MGQGFYLYTGKIGFLQSWRELGEMGLILLGNFLGTLLAALLCRAAALNLSSAALCSAKLEQTWGMTLVRSMLCGVLMFLAIDNYRKTKAWFFVALPVVIFILSGFEHSIAKLFYFCLDGIVTPERILYLLWNIVGNGMGALLFARAQNFLFSKKGT